MRERWLGAALVAVVVIGALVACTGDATEPTATEPTATPGVVEIRTVAIGDPGNASVGIVPFQGPPKQGIYRDCDGAPTGCLLVGGVEDEYRMGELVTYRVELSRKTEQGMYDLDQTQTGAGAKRDRSTGLVVPSQDEWIKAAYYDPAGGGKFSYWQYPTDPVRRPNASALDPDSGDVVNADEQRLSTYNPEGVNAPEGTYPTWCPPQVGQDACERDNPLGLSPRAHQSIYQGNLSTVGQTRSRSPWGTLDQGGNVVEWTDTITPSPTGYDERVWRRMHGGIANARAYQLWISAVGLLAQDDLFFERTYPWVGLRVAVIGDPE